MAFASKPKGSQRLHHLPPCLQSVLHEHLSDAYVFTTPGEWMRGLLFRTPRIALFCFPRLTRSAFHALGFTYAIGMISLAHGRVQEGHLLKPWHVWKPKRVYDMMIEIPLSGESYIQAWHRVQACIPLKGGKRMTMKQYYDK